MTIKRWAAGPLALGLLLILLMIFRPQGLLGARRQPLETPGR